MNPFTLAERIGQAAVDELSRLGVDIGRFALTGEARVLVRSSGFASISSPERRHPSAQPPDGAGSGGWRLEPW
jgi:hypothetical protein